MAHVRHDACLARSRPRFSKPLSHGCATATDIGARLKAGTNCGSCVPELKALLAQHVVKKIA
jgi:assimilatory nitrate reductase catalytic subunit